MRVSAVASARRSVAARSRPNRPGHSPRGSTRSAGSPALRGSVAAASEPPAGRRPAVDQLDRVAVAQRRRRTARLGHRVPHRARPSRRPAPESRLGRTSIGGGEVLLAARRTSAARRRPSRRPRRRRRAPRRPGRGSAAGRRRPSSRPRPTAGRPGTASRASACGASACPARARWRGPRRG